MKNEKIENLLIELDESIKRKDNSSEIQNKLHIIAVEISKSKKYSKLYGEKFNELIQESRKLF